MNNMAEFNICKNSIIGEEIGTVSVSMFMDKNTGKYFFYVRADNEEVLQLSYVIEDTLYNY